MLAGIIGSKKTCDEESLMKILQEKAKNNCNKCYGRGHIGYIDQIIPKKHKHGEEKISLDIKYFQLCPCITKNDKETLNIKL